MKRPVVIAIPERETPGISARICEVPIQNAGQKPRFSNRRCWGERSATQSSTPKTLRKIAICQGWPRWFSIVLSPSAPAIAAGIVAKKIHQATRSSCVRIPRCTTERNHAPT